MLKEEEEGGKGKGKGGGEGLRRGRWWLRWRNDR